MIFVEITAVFHTKVCFRTFQRRIFSNFSFNMDPKVDKNVNWIKEMV